MELVNWEFLFCPSPNSLQIEATGNTGQNRFRILIDKPEIILLSVSTSLRTQQRYCKTLKNSSSDNLVPKSIWQAKLLNLHLERHLTIKYKNAVVV